jgi:predicted transglutaminase-like cysteine proteinase
MQAIEGWRGGAAGTMRRLMRAVRAIGAGFGLAALALVAPAAAQTLASLPHSTPTVEKAGLARPVVAWTLFCQRNPDECAVDTSEPAVVTLTPRMWRDILSVNRSVNARVRPMTDLEHWGTVDRWDLPDDGYGDCEDYQLLKRKILVQRGLPRRAMRMTVVIDEQGEGHAVLTIRTNRGDFILDNKRSSVLPWQQTDYVFVKRESQEGQYWASLGERSSPVTTANR